MIKDPADRKQFIIEVHIREASTGFGEFINLTAIKFLALLFK